ncbi:MAG TPA: PAS domain S-box protein [Aurantimonas coralicida]|uniref:histidine kinase n=2 Tax=root TaxID=1 RepID=A0A9C9NIW3_9HYPH|nr:PAS domain S-box protein [Aurantimonas coralicida]HEU02780.1 PAS domain S-box protein [Aurantimonas coralicida]
MTSLWQSLFANLALVAILVVLWDFISEWTGRLSVRLQPLLLGLIMGGGAIVSMATAQPLIAGFVFDLRGPLVVAAAFFGGLPAVAIAGTAALIYRLYLGGMGAPAGALDVLIACLVGLAGFWWTRSRPKTTSLILIFALVVAFGRLIAYVAVPADMRMALLASTGFPLVALTFVSTVLMTVVLQWQARRRDLSTSNLIYRAMVRELPDCLNVKDMEGRFVVANPATATLMRANTAEGLIGKSDFDFYPADLAEKFRQDEAAMLKRGKPERVDQETLLPNGTTGWLSTLKVPLRNEQGRIVGIITYNRDITEMKRAAQVKAEFIATVSHELRTPLTSIRGSLGLVAAGMAGELPAKAARLVEIAHDNSERLVLLINDILDMEKIESGKMQFNLRPTPLRDLIEGAISASANYLPERQIQTVLIDDAPRAQANIDPNRLHQVLANLLSNAIKFSPVGATVTVKIGRREGGRLRLSVIDTGPGIQDAFRERIFGKFEQADASDTREKGGTGLGLSIAKAIVEKLDGTIGFDTQLGAGTVFYVDLAEFVAASRDPDLPPESGDLRPRILHVEDDESVLHIMSMGLGTDVSIASARSLTEARQILAHSQFDVVILDVALPDGSGLDLLPDLPEQTAVIVFSAAEISHDVHARVRATVTKTRSSELDVARLVKSFLPASTLSPGA